MKLFIGMPARDGRITAQTAIALYQEQDVARQRGVELVPCIVPGVTEPHAARDRVVAQFMATDADKLIFVDDDVSWEAGSLLRLAAHPVEFVGGCYRFKCEPERYPIQWLDKPELWADPDTGLLEVCTLPFGFLSLSRSVFQTIATARPRLYTDQMGNVLQGFFHAPYGGSEDTAFCVEWRELGGKVWLDPEIALNHTGGNVTYRGHIGQWLLRR